MWFNWFLSHLLVCILFGSMRINQIKITVSISNPWINHAWKIKNLRKVWRWKSIYWEKISKENIKWSNKRSTKRLYEFYMINSDLLNLDGLNNNIQPNRFWSYQNFSLFDCEKKIVFNSKRFFILTKKKNHNNYQKRKGKKNEWNEWSLLSKCKCLNLYVI